MHYNLVEGSMGTKLGLFLLLLCFCNPVLAGEDSEEKWMPEIIQQVTQRKAAPLALYVDQLPQTKKIYSYFRRGQKYFPLSLTIGMYQKQMKFHRDLPPTTVFAYGTSEATATFPGPTVEAVRYIPTFVTWKNNLPLTHILPVDFTIAVAMARNGGIPAVVHLHGGIVAPDSDGSAFAWYTANYTNVGKDFTKYTYTYPNIQHSGNLMYHDHALGLTRVNLLAGLLGAYVIRDPLLDFSLNLPQGDEFDRHLVIADRSFLADGSIYMNHTGVNPDIHPVWRPEYFGDTITVNGKVWPYLNVQQRKYRFRIINACNARYLNLSFSINGSPPLPFVIVGSDSSYLPVPVTTTSIVASVAEIFDVIFDFSPYSSKEIELINTAPYPYPNGNVTDIGSKDSKVMKFIVSRSPTFDPSIMPPKLVTYEPASPSDATVTRYIAMYEYFSSTNQTTHLYINGKRLLDPATETPNPGSTELWNVINLTGDDHPLHLHLAHFQAIKMQEILDLDTFKNCMKQKANATQCNINGLATGKTQPIPDYEKTWKNVVKIPPGWMTTVIVKFKLVDSKLPYPFDATKEPGYVYHCHILDHEDNEMIRPLKLVKN